MKKVFKYLLFLLPWFISGLLFRYDSDFYSNLIIPSFALPKVLISIIWIILYILISISIYKVSDKTCIVKNSDYFYVLITNYLSNQLFLFGFFTLRSPFMGFILTTTTFVSSVFLFLETKKIDKKASYFLIPYLIFSIYAFILSLSIYIMNF